MRLVTHHALRGRRLAVLVGAVILAAATMQCRMVTDNVVRPLQGPEAAASCIKSCNDAAKDAIRAEVDLHHDNVQACDGDSTCLDREEARHEAAIDAIQQTRRVCQNNCHHQGGGAAGR